MIMKRLQNRKKTAATPVPRRMPYPTFPAKTIEENLGVFGKLNGLNSSRERMDIEETKNCV